MFLSDPLAEARILASEHERTSIEVRECVTQFGFNLGLEFDLLIAALDVGLSGENPGVLEAEGTGNERWARIDDGIRSVVGADYIILAHRLEEVEFDTTASFVELRAVGIAVNVLKSLLIDQVLSVNHFYSALSIELVLSRDAITLLKRDVVSFWVFVPEAHVTGYIEVRDCIIVLAAIASPPAD